MQLSAACSRVRRSCSSLTSPGGWAGSGGREHPGKSSHSSSVSSVSSQARLSQSSSNSHSLLETMIKISQATRGQGHQEGHRPARLRDLQVVEHPLHLLVDLTGGGATGFLLLGPAHLTLGHADRVLPLASVHRLGGLFAAAVQGRLVVGSLQADEKEVRKE